MLPLTLAITAGAFLSFDRQPQETVEVQTSLSGVRGSVSHYLICGDGSLIAGLRLRRTGKTQPFLGPIEFISVTYYAPDGTVLKDERDIPLILPTDFISGPTQSFTAYVLLRPPLLARSFSIKINGTEVVTRPVRIR